MKRKNGFTLIELIIVTAVIGIVSAIGTSGLIDYTRTAKLNSAANDLITTLNVAKSNALSQVKDPTLCSSLQPLEGYKVAVNACTTYDLYVRCGGADKKVMNTKSLPKDIVFTNTAPASFFFPILTGGAVGSSTITASGYGKTRCASVTSTGVISQSSTCPASLPCLTPTPTPVPSVCADGTTEQDFGTTSAGKKVDGCNGSVLYASAGTLCVAGGHAGDIVLDSGLREILQSTPSVGPMDRWIKMNGDPGNVLGHKIHFDAIGNTDDYYWCWGTQAPCDVAENSVVHPTHRHSASYPNHLFLNGAEVLSNYGGGGNNIVGLGAICVQN